MALMACLLDLPTEILQEILLLLSTPSFVHTSISCKALFQLVNNSRSIVLHHLQHVPGIKIGLDDPTISTPDLFLIFRQRASKHLYGANFSANCLELKSSNALIDADASSMSDMDLDKDYVTMSLVMKNTLTVRLYNSACALKDMIGSPFYGGKPKILQVVHRRSTIAILYQWQAEKKQRRPPWIEKALIRDHPYKKPNNLHITSPPVSDSEDYLSDDDTEPPKEVHTKMFHLQLHDSLSTDRPVTYTIDEHKGLVPRHLAVSSRLQWAILWDSADSHMPTDDCEIVKYNAVRSSEDGEPPFMCNVAWPTAFDIRPTAPSHDEIDKGMTIKRPIKIRFFKDGRRMSMYSPGDIVPYKVLSVGSHRDSRSPTNSIYFENQTRFRVDTSFFGVHESYWDPDTARQYCHTSHLCLGVGEVWQDSRGCRVLCILRSRSKSDHDDCPHTAELNRMNHVTAENCKAVARLWGWSSASSTLTGIDTVAISHYGTRIAVAQWNRVLIWSLDPKMLCEEIVDFEEDDGKKQKKKDLSKPSSVAEEFYERTKDKQMGWKIANIKPIVIDLDGAVARKMSWTIQTENDEEDASEEDDSEITTSSAESLNEDQAGNTLVEKIFEDQPQDLAGQDSSADLAALDTIPVPEQTQSPENTDLKTISDTNEQSDEDKTQQTNIGVEPLETDAPKVLPDRTLAATNSHRGRPTALVSPIGTMTTKTKAQVNQDNSIVISETTSPTAEADGVGESNNVIMEASLSLLDKPSTESKGKEKEISLPLPISRTPTPTEMSAQPTAKPKPKARRKRFTEDELVIMTDRGFQIWDFGVWSKGTRKKEWLNDELESLHR